MRIGWHFAIFLIVLMVSSCSGSDTISKVIVRLDKDNVSLNDTVTVKLFVKNCCDRFPEFFLVEKADTHQIYYDKDLKCGVFKSIARKKGEKTYTGYVNYEGEIQKQKRVDFKVSYLYIQNRANQPERWFTLGIAFGELTSFGLSNKLFSN